MYYTIYSYAYLELPIYLLLYILSVKVQQVAHLARVEVPQQQRFVGIGQGSLRHNNRKSLRHKKIKLVR